MLQSGLLLHICVMYIFGLSISVLATWRLHDNYCMYVSTDSVVVIATGYGLHDRWGRSSNPGVMKNFLFSTSSRPALVPTQPPIEWVRGALSPEIKRQGREADHLSPTSAEVKKMWIYTSIPPYALMA
jgi:hypothetical protein